MRNPRIAVIGAGNIGRALVRGFLDSGKCKEDRIMATIPSEEKAATLREELGVRMATDNREACQGAQVVIFCVKPQVLPSVLEEVADVLTEDKLIISVAAGITTRFIEERLGKEVSVVRLMPNVAVLSRQGATGMCTGRWAKDEEVEYVKDLFSSVGLVVTVTEDLMDAVTGLSGTGPMYVFQVIEGLSDAGVKVGLSRDMASTLAVQTVLGAALMARDLGVHPARLKDFVTSPGGTAISALHLMERSSFRSILMDAVEVASDKSAELGEMHMSGSRD